MVRLKLSAILLFCIPFFAFSQKKGGTFFKIPDLQVKVANSGIEGLQIQEPTASSVDVSPYRTRIVQVSAFEISKQVTLQEYKQFLDAMRQDSGVLYFKKLLPDSSISNSAKYHLYLSDPVYESYPVVGVSWENALRYCLWRSLREHETNETEFYYRLPTEEEWEAANINLTGKNSSDINQDYADWLVNAYFENSNSFLHDLSPDVQNKYRDDNSVSAKRKRYIGNSYFISFRNPSSFNGLYQYKDAGLPFLGFRCVRVWQPDLSSAEIFQLFLKDFGVKF